VFGRTGIQFAIGKSSGSTFAKAIIGIGINDLVAVKFGNIEFAGANFFASFNNYRFKIIFDKCEGGK